MKKLILPILSLLVLLSNADARFWTNKSGRTFEGEFVGVKDNAVTIRRTIDRRKFTMPLMALSEADQKYIANYKSENDSKNKAPEYPIPTTAEELKTWIVKTEWVLTEEDNIEVIRFYPDGIVKYQANNKRWDRGSKPTKTRKYKIKSANTLRFGFNKNRNTTFNEDFKKLSYSTGKGESGEGKFIRRFELGK